MNARTVGIGLVGCGSFGESHLQAYRAVRGAEVRAVFDLDRSRAEQLATHFNIPKVCTSLAELCATPGIEIVDVVTGEAHHREPVLAALAGGKHVFVEKPLAANLDDCRAMIDASRKAQRYLMVGHLLRFETRYAMLKEQIAAGRLGTIVSMHAKRNRLKAHVERHLRVHLALETAIHDIDYMLWCIESPVRRVRAYARASQSTKTDTLWGVLEFDNGAIGVVQTLWMLPEAAGVGLDDAVQVIGSEGVGNLSLSPGSLTFWTDRGHDVPDVGYDPRVMNAARGALHDELAYFVDCVADAREPTINTAVEATRAVRVALALIESAESGRDVELREWDA